MHIPFLKNLSGTSTTAVFSISQKLLGFAVLALVVSGGCGRPILHDQNLKATSKSAKTSSEPAERETFAASRHPNALSGKTFKCMGNGFVFENIEVDSYELSDWRPPVDRPDFGQYVTFTEQTFEAYNSTMCGNDVFVQSKGTYTFLQKDVVQIFVQTIKRNEYCVKKSETPNRSFGNFKILKETNQPGIIRLVRLEAPPNM